MLFASVERRGFLIMQGTERVAESRAASASASAHCHAASQRYSQRLQYLRPRLLLQAMAQGWVSWRQRPT